MTYKQQKLFAIAALATMASSAQAQSSVTLFGALDGASGNIGNASSLAPTWNQFGLGVGMMHTF